MAKGTHNSKLTVAAVAIAVTAGMIWLSGDGGMLEPIVSAPDRVAAAAPPSASSFTPPAEPAPLESPAAPPEPSADDAAQDRIAARAEEIERELARQLHARGGNAMIRVLIDNGMAPSDSEEIVRRAMDDIAACVIDALRAEADTGIVPMDTLLFALEAVIAETDTPEAVEMLSTDTIAANAEACTYAVGQQAGLPIG